MWAAGVPMRLGIKVGVPISAWLAGPRFLYFSEAPPR